MFGWTAAFIHNHLCITCYLRVRGFVIFVPLSVCCHYTSTFYNMWITSHKRTNKISFIYHMSCSLISKQFFKIFYLEKTISVESVKLSPPPFQHKCFFANDSFGGEIFISGANIKHNYMQCNMDITTTDHGDAPLLFTFYFPNGLVHVPRYKHFLFEYWIKGLHIN